MKFLKIKHIMDISACFPRVVLACCPSADWKWSFWQALVDGLHAHAKDAWTGTTLMWLDGSSGGVGEKKPCVRVARIGLYSSKRGRVHVLRVVVGLWSIKFVVVISRRTFFSTTLCQYCLAACTILPRFFYVTAELDSRVEQLFGRASIKDSKYICSEGLYRLQIYLFTKIEAL